MMMAMTTGAEIPDRHGCNGCYGCSGCYASCGGCHRGHGHRGHRCHGCYGCSGCYVSYGCCGCYGSYGGGCYGGGYGCAGYGGGYGCAGYGGAGYGCGGGGVVPGGGVPVMPDAGGGKGGKTLPEPEKGKGTKGSTQAEGNGTILVSLPADARLTVDGHATTSTTAQRTLITPNLQPGYEYTYTLRAEINRDGQTLTQSQRVAVRAGQQTPVTFDFAPSSVASAK
jgi:uncharacterized protein (TIGR03000 family)